MNEYRPPYNISDKMLRLVASISEKIGRIEMTNTIKSKPHLRKNNRIQSIHSSLKIEANSLSIGDVKDVIDGRLVMGPEREIQEVRNAYAAYEQISEVDPFSQDDLKKLHGIMEQRIQYDAGRFRSGDEGVFEGDHCIFIAPPAQRVPTLVAGLFSWMKAEKRDVHPLIMAAVFHYEFVFIHPFSDGNGRMARLWHTILLANWKPIFEYIPLESQIEKFQDGYYQAIADSHAAGRSDTFIEFMLMRIDAILDEVIGMAGSSNAALSKYVRRMLDVMDVDVPYTATAIMERIGLKSKETFRKNYLNPAMAFGLVVMTVPDKPRSRNQCYIKK